MEMSIGDILQLFGFGFEVSGLLLALVGIWASSFEQAVDRTVDNAAENLAAFRGRVRVRIEEVAVAPLDAFSAWALWRTLWTVPLALLGVVAWVFEVFGELDSLAMGSLTMLMLSVAGVAWLMRIVVVALRQTLELPSITAERIHGALDTIGRGNVVAGLGLSIAGLGLALEAIQSGEVVFRMLGLSFG